MVMVEILVLLLLLDSGLVICRDTNQDLTSTVIQYTDTCSYSTSSVRCGDRCTIYHFDCECGDTKIDFKKEVQQCCVPLEDSQGRSGAEGVVTEDRQCTMDGKEVNGEHFEGWMKCAGGVGRE